MTLDAQVPAPRRPEDGRVSAGRPGGATVFVLPAEIDIANSVGVAAALCGQLRAGEVIADLTATTFCDSSGIAALLRASGEAEILGRDLRLAVRPAGAVFRVLELTGFAAQLRLFGSVREAVRGRR